jgi:transcriptional regulator with XRE-family HTH domain
MIKETNITSAQIRAARGMLNWSARQLAERAGISQLSIHRAERAQGRPNMRENTLAAIKTALESHGIEFLGDSGVRLVLLQAIAGEGVLDPSPRPSADEAVRNDFSLKRQLH